MGRFSEAVGVWEIKFCEPVLELRPKMSDVRLFRNIVVNNSKDKNKLLDKFADYMFSLIIKEYPQESEEELRDWIEINVNPLLDECMIAFKWTTREELAKTKEEALADIKKKMMSSD